MRRPPRHGPGFTFTMMASLSARSISLLGSLLPTGSRPVVATSELLGIWVRCLKRCIFCKACRRAIFFLHVCNCHCSLESLFSLMPHSWRQLCPRRHWIGMDSAVCCYIHSSPFCASTDFALPTTSLGAWNAHFAACSNFFFSHLAPSRLCQ